MFIGVPLLGRRIYKVRSSDEVNDEYEISKEGWTRQIFESYDGVPGC